MTLHDQTRRPPVLLSLFLDFLRHLSVVGNANDPEKPLGCVFGVLGPGGSLDKPPTSVQINNGQPVSKS